MGIETMGPPPELTKLLRDTWKLASFVETGTYLAETALWAAGEFEHVVTIEAAPHFFREAQVKLAPYANVRVMHGNTTRILAPLVATLPPTLFFLDAHWSTGDTAGIDDECPLLTELALIMPWFRRHVVMIDDARFFLQPPVHPHKVIEWPSIDDIIRTTGGAAYVVLYRDVLVLVPNIFRQKLAEAIRSLVPET